MHNLQYYTQVCTHRLIVLIHTDAHTYVRFTVRVTVTVKRTHVIVGAQTLIDRRIPPRCGLYVSSMYTSRLNNI